MRIAKIAIVLVIAMLVTMNTSAGSRQAGDLNGDGVVDVYDLIITRRYVLGIQDLDKKQKEDADINKDGLIDDSDLQLIRNLCMGGNEG